MKYRYIEFTDKTAVSAKGRKCGKLYCTGKPSPEIIAELELEQEKTGYDGSIISYTTTLQNMGEKGWELQFVTPCGVNFARRDSMAGPIENSYIFRKTMDREDKEDLEKANEGVVEKYYDTMKGLGEE